MKVLDCFLGGLDRAEPCESDSSALAFIVCDKKTFKIMSITSAGRD